MTASRPDRKILVTGAGGFIGRHCLPKLLERGYEIHAISRTGSLQNMPGVSWHQIDLLSQQEELRRTISQLRPSHLLHLAWVTEHGTYWESPLNFQWVLSSFELVRGFREAGGLRAVLAGTCAEYRWDDTPCIESQTPTEPGTTYGKCKRALQLLVDAYSQSTGLSSAWGRIFFAYGPYENPKRFIPSLAAALIKDEPAKCTEGNQVRDFLHAEDIADAFVSLLESPVAGPINIGSGQGVRLRDVAHLLARSLNKTELLALGALPSPATDPQLIVADTNRLQDELGWQPRIELDSGLLSTLNWWQKELTGSLPEG